MKAILCLILVSSLFINTINAAAVLAATTTVAGWDLIIADASTTNLYPIAVTQTTGGASYAAIASASTASSPVAAAPGVSNAWTVSFKSGAGVPNSWQFVWSQVLATGTAVAASGVVVTVPVGPQVALSVSGAYSGGTGQGETAGTLQTSASAVSATATTCGAYYIDCAAGVLTFQAYFPTGASAVARVCTVTITQLPAVFGGLAYATTLPTGAQAQLATAVTSNSNGSGSPTWCGTLTNSGNTVYLFTQPLATSAATADINTAQAKLLAAIKAKTAFTGSARLLEESERVLATSYTLVNGYATALPTSNSAGIVAPSTTASASLAANATSQNRVVVLAGLLTTVLAAVFGLAL